MEAYDGQWANLVFRDHHDKPLTLFELQRDCWLKFKSMSKEKLVNFIEGLSKNPANILAQWSTTSFSEAKSLCIGNIRTVLGWHTKETRIPIHMAHCKTFLALESYCNEFNCEGGLSMVTFPDVDSRPKLWEVKISD